MEVRVEADGSHGGDPRADLEDARRRDDPNDISDALLVLALNDADWRWVQGQCLELFDHADEATRGLAVTCLGHIARIHGHLDHDIVIPRLKLAARDSRIAGRVDDALDDIAMYAPDR